MQSNGMTKKHKKCNERGCDIVHCKCLLQAGRSKLEVRFVSVDAVGREKES